MATLVKGLVASVMVIFSGVARLISSPKEEIHNYNDPQNVLLVSPKHKDGFWGLRHIKPFVGKKANMPSLGLAIVSSLCPGNWTKRLVDMNVRKLRNRHLKWADIVMISAFIAQEESANEVIRRAEALGKTVIVGGPLYTLQHEETPGVDHFVLGQAEDSFMRFLKDWMAGKPKHRYEQERWPDHSETPLPDWSLFDLEKYICLPLQNSWGCPFRCKFCAQVKLSGGKVKVKSGEQFALELEHAITVAKWRRIIWIVDDNFIGNIVTVTKETLPWIIKVQKKHNYPVKLMAEGDMRLASHSETLKLMGEANIAKWFTGAETPVDECLAETGKGQNRGVDMVESMHILMRHGLMVLLGAVVGFDAEVKRKDIFSDHISFYRSIGAPVVTFFLQQVYPRTQLEKEMKEAGRLLETTSGDHGVQLTYVPMMHPVELLEGYIRSLKYLASPKESCRRIALFLSHYEPTVRKRVGLHNLKDVRATLYVITKIGMSYKWAPHFWLLMVETLRKKPKALTEMMEYVIWTYHQNRIYNKSIRDARRLIESGKLDEISRPTAVEVISENQVRETEAEPILS
ncbi:DUF4070 domain-containing protein [candidate division WS5 bacterium]|uniref:DUF4070 domain-containing protein n=1 Tax=candidate division WS5 bacterium TaxID=2093353 RepID=A0A419DGP1_9BACT|nr:MAG: DUF4070 domain-containing protein [candidate division WS5 bacterium]